MQDLNYVQDLRCRWCRKPGWKDVWALNGHEGRCKAKPSKTDRVSSLLAGFTNLSPVPQQPLGTPQGGAQAPQALGNEAPTPAASTPSGGQALEARVVLLEEEIRLLREIAASGLGKAEPPPSPSPLPWVVLGGAVVLGGLWLVGVFGSGNHEVPAGAFALGDAQRRPPSAGSTIVGKFIDKVAGKVIDKALNRLF